MIDFRKSRLPSPDHSDSQWNQLHKTLSVLYSWIRFIQIKVCIFKIQKTPRESMFRTWIAYFTYHIINTVYRDIVFT